MKGSLSALHPLLVLIVAGLAVSAAGVSRAETIIRDLSGTKIIKSTEAPHNILGEACIACHPKEKFDFWLLIHKGKPPTVSVERPADAGATGQRGGTTPAEAMPRDRYNAHSALACGFCHFDDPKESSPKFIVDVKSLCQMCHQSTPMHRMPEGAALKRVSDAAASGKLPGIEGKVSCTTCHKLHGATYGMREAYARILHEGTVPKPHGDRMLCFTCHPEAVREGKEVRLPPGKDAVSVCNECHLKPGVRQAPHVVGVAAAEGSWKTEYLGYPLEDGKLTCVTCHDEVSHGTPDAANPKFLRGGPYSDPERFCARCHIEQVEGRNNPHRQLDGFGRIRPESCRFCHRGVPDPSNPGGGEAALIADETGVCAGCHRVSPHPGVDHILPITQRMDARRIEYEQKHQVRIPVGEGGIIRCSSCHNPHAKGVIKGSAGVGASSMWRVPDFREVCAPCHGRY